MTLSFNNKSQGHIFADSKCEVFNKIIAPQSPLRPKTTFMLNPQSCHQGQCNDRIKISVSVPLSLILVKFYLVLLIFVVVVKSQSLTEFLEAVCLSVCLCSAYNLE